MEHNFNPDNILKYFGTDMVQLKLSIYNNINTGTYILTMAIATLWALFGEDCRIAFMPKSADLTCSVLSALVFFLFIMDLVLNLISRYIAIYIHV